MDLHSTKLHSMELHSVGLGLIQLYSINYCFSVGANISSISTRLKNTRVQRNPSFI